MDTVTVPKSLITELLSSITELKSLILPSRKDVNLVDRCTERIRNLGHAAGFQFPESSSNLVENISSNVVEDSSSNLVEEPSEITNQDSPNSASSTTPKTVRTRKRRVSKKVNTNKPEKRRSAKYLKEILHDEEEFEDRAHAYLQYLNNCHFNTGKEKSCVMEFNDMDAQDLASLVYNSPSDFKPKCLERLSLAIEQRFQLAVQQSYEIGSLLVNTQRIFKEDIAQNLVSEEETEQTVINRDCLEILEEFLDANISKSTLKEHITVWHVVNSLPLLKYVNEPLSHLLDINVRDVCQSVTDLISTEMVVPENIHRASSLTYVYSGGITEEEGYCCISPNLEEIEEFRIVPVDGDGAVLLNTHFEAIDEQVENGIHIRLAQVDAPELYTKYYIRNEEGTIIETFPGHISLLAFHYYIRVFVKEGTAVLAHEVPESDESTVDQYGRAIVELWFQWKDEPKECEMKMLEEIISAAPDDIKAKKRLSSCLRHGSPYSLSLNALLVLGGFCYVYPRYCLDNNILALQRSARDNNRGCIWSTSPKTSILGHRQIDDADLDVRLLAMGDINLEELQITGFPTKFHQRGCSPIYLQPWYERKMKRRLQSASKRDLEEHFHSKSVGPPYGFTINIDPSSKPRCYTTVKTAEGYLRVNPSSIVGIGGSSTGNGLYTVRNIKPKTWICAYAPSATLKESDPERGGDYVFTFKWNGITVDIDGGSCPLGLGINANDGTFPLCLRASKFQSLIKARVNAEFSVRDKAELWLKSTKTIKAGEEILVRYSHDNSYWKDQFSQEHLTTIRDALDKCEAKTMEEINNVIRKIQLL